MTAPVLDTKIDTNSDAYRAAFAHNSALRDELWSKVAEAALGGNAKSRERHTARGKLLPRDRVERLLDPGSPFLEIGQLAACDQYDGEIPGAGMIAGIGRVSGRQCMIVCNDATVKGGTYYPMTVKKHCARRKLPRPTGCRASTSSTAAARTCRTRPRSSPIANISAESSSTRRT